MSCPLRTGVPSFLETFWYVSQSWPREGPKEEVRVRWPPSFTGRWLSLGVSASALSAWTSADAEQASSGTADWCLERQEARERELASLSFAELCTVVTE